MIVRKMLILTSTTVKRKISPFHACGIGGTVLAAAVAIALAEHKNLSLPMIVTIIIGSIVTFLSLVLINKIITGEERIIYYHHEIGVMSVTTLLLWVLRQPLLPYLDVTILGIGTFLVCGRIGCLVAGCCHGRPCGWGVQYGEEHAAAGFPSYLVGVRLFPIQAVESVWVLCTVIVGVFFVWNGTPPGTALAWYLITYDLGRFMFEFARGDAGRSYSLGYSQPQWLSLLLTGGIVWAEAAGVLPLHRWHLGAFILLVAVMVTVSLKRRLQPTPAFRLLHPKHIKQIASAMKAVCVSTNEAAAHPAGTPTTVSVARTTLGIQISGSEMQYGAELVYHYTFCSAKEVMTERAAWVLAGLIRRLKGAACHGELIAGSRGVFHLLIWAPAKAKA